ncbi:MAG: hypothetical protein ACTHN5_01760 [Phycisphaerae bacterium]
MLAAADTLFHDHKLDEARAAYTHLYKTSQNPSEQAEAAAMVARTFLTLDHKEDARPWLETARQLASPDLPRGYSRYLAVRGRMEWKDHHFETAQATFKSLYDFCKSHHFPDRALDALMMLAIVSPLPEQIAWSKLAIAEAQAAKMDEQLGALWNNLGATHEDLNQHAEALEAYRHARDYHRRFSPPLAQLKADYAIAHTQRLLARNAEARELLTLLLPAFEELANDEFLGWTCHELAHLQLADNNPVSAHDYFIRAKSHLIDAGIATWDPATLERIVTHIAHLQPRPPL